MVEREKLMKRRPATRKWPRWIGFAASIFVLALLLLNLGHFLERDRNPTTVILVVGLFVVPALAAAILCFTRLFWTIVLPGSWFLFIAVVIRLDNRPPAWSSLLLFGALAMLLAPFVGWASGWSDGSTDSKSPDQSNDLKR